MSVKRKQAIFSEINITPLTDIFLVLLILLMVIAPMLDSKGISLATPTAQESADQKEDPKTFDLVINAEGQYLVNAEEVLAPQLVATFKKLKETAPDGIVVRVAPQTKHAIVVKALDAVSQSGIKKLAVVRQD